MRFWVLSLLAGLTFGAAAAQAPQTVRPPAAEMKGDAIGATTRRAPETAEEVKLSFAPIVEAAAPAVVNVYTSRVVQRTTGDPFFDRFFGVGPQQQNSLGSGVIVSRDGVIVTNNHVVENMNEIKVVLSDRREFAARVLLADPQSDVAVLRIDAGEPLPFLEFANSDAAEVGDIVLAIGNPFGVGQTVTSGIISALARTAVSISDYQFFIQTDAAINPGNSGGALIDVNGKLLGVNTAIFSRSGGSNGIGFAIPARLVQQVLATATKGVALHRPWVGATTETVTTDIAKALKLDRPIGAIVGDVYPLGPLARAGIKQGDVIVSIDGQPVFDAETLRYRVGVQNPGDRAKVEYIRGGKRMNAEMIFSLPPETPSRDERTLTGSHPLNGVTIANLSPRFNEELGLNPLLTGVVVTEVAQGSFAYRSRLRRGFRVLAVNGVKVSSTAELQREIAKQSGGWTIDIDRGDRIIAWRVGR
ncbi:MAG: Do family serine endopeptidase [Parvularculaceae bacterium]|nr:Do family serine endopeptidase [Parvularculaceae bacterium]